MFKRKLLKQNKIKRFLLKLFNLYALDKETFELINPKFDQKAENYFKFNDKSVILSTGFLTFKRKIKKLDIFIDIPQIFLFGIHQENGKELFLI